MWRFRIGAIALAVFLAAHFTPAQAAEETVVCKDGSASKSGRGACSGHGGVDKKATEAAAPKKVGPSAAAPETTVICKDGSTSKAGKGACSGHGGVDKKASKAGPKGDAPQAVTPPPAAVPPASPAARPAAAPPAPAARGETSAKTTAKNTDPTGATAKCKDGSYSHAKHHTGACSNHGGVAEWLDEPAK